MRVNANSFYLERKVKEGKGKFRNWFIVKHTNYENGHIPMSNISFPKEFIGKKVRLKVELVDDG